MHAITLTLAIAASLLAIVPAAAAAPSADVATHDCLDVATEPPTATVGFGCTCFLFPTAIYC
jgi:hypothetical protein